MGKQIIVIDGPAGAGKSTAAKRLAARLGALYLDTGAMYRACTLRALRLGVELTDSDALAEVVDEATVRLEHEEGAEHGACRVYLDGEDVSDAIRTREVTGNIHYLASCPAVRERLVRQQQALARDASRSVVAEGRDLGSVVFPAADVKVYLDASVEERASRRLADLGEAAPSLEELRADIELRDQRDTGRRVGPLIRTEDAIYVDSSRLTLEEVVERLAQLAADDTHKRRGGKD